MGGIIRGMGGAINRMPTQVSKQALSGLQNAGTSLLKGAEGVSKQSGSIIRGVGKGFAESVVDSEFRSALKGDMGGGLAGKMFKSGQSSTVRQYKDFTPNARTAGTSYPTAKTIHQMNPSFIASSPLDPSLTGRGGFGASNLSDAIGKE